MVRNNGYTLCKETNEWAAGELLRYPQWPSRGGPCPERHGSLQDNIERKIKARNCERPGVFCGGVHFDTGPDGTAVLGFTRIIHQAHDEHILLAESRLAGIRPVLEIRGWGGQIQYGSLREMHLLEVCVDPPTKLPHMGVASAVAHGVGVGSEHRSRRNQNCRHITTNHCLTTIRPVTLGYSESPLPAFVLLATPWRDQNIPPIGVSLDS